MNYMTIAGLILVCLAAALGLIEWWSKRRGETFIARLSFSGVVVFLLSGTFWYFGNIYYGNNAAWNLILVWLEGQNGEATLQPWLTSFATATVVNLLPSIGQWWRWRFQPTGYNSTVSYILSAIDLGMNTIGFYVAYAPFTPPIDWLIFAGMGIAAYFPNFWCQEICQDSWGQVVIHFNAELPKGKKKKYKSLIPTIEELLS